MRPIFFLITVFLFWVQFISAQSANIPAEWKFYQDLKAGMPSVYKYKLPLEVVDKGMPLLEDLRILDIDGKEVPYLLEAARPVIILHERLLDFKAKLEGTKTILTARSDSSGYFDSIILDTPANAFIKPVDVFLSMDETQWTKVSEGVPIFRQYCASENLRVDITPVNAKFIKVVIDDSRSIPVPFSGIRARVSPIAPPLLETADVVMSKEEHASSSRITIKLPARNLFVFAVEISVANKLFSRNISVSTRLLEDYRVVTKPLCSDTIFSTDAAGSAVSRTKVPVYAQFKGTNEMIIDIKNDNSPPLDIESVKVFYAPVYVIFQAKSAGIHRMLFGNRRAQSRIYDLGEISRYLIGKDFSTIVADKPTLNPSFSEPEAIPKLDAFGGTINTEKWLYKTPVSVERFGVQGLDLNFQIVSRAKRDLSDLRLVSDSLQVPYILDRNYTERSMPVSAESQEIDSKSVWRIKLPCKNFPLTHITCIAPDTIFQRRVTLYETVSDKRGRTHRMVINSTVWSNNGQGSFPFYSISTSHEPSGEEIELEVENGDNKPIQFSGFKLHYHVSRLIFKWKESRGLWLYYGNNNAHYPTYDISLVAQELMNEEKYIARLEGETGPSEGWGFQLSSTLSKAVFWTVLTAIAALLIFLIVRLLPPSAQTNTK